ncbi:hypothetical protein F5Y16DRAFT_402259 [Xylariaceae sp. FL0255]|nr:hypothetical protein F5Y16DRAFT_402259 [Xylariaceae sp. FL0255]
MPAKSLDDIATELFLGILQHLDIPSLKQACLVNKAFRTSAQQMLHSAIIWHWDDTVTPPLHLLLRTCLERPDLADSIRKLVISCGGAYRPLYDANYMPVLKPIPHLLGIVDDSIVAIKATGVQFTNEWVERPDVLLSVPNISTLEICSPYLDYPESDLSSFSMLRTLNLYQVYSSKIEELLSRSFQLQELNWLWIDFRLIHQRPVETTNILDLDEIDASLPHVQNSLTSLSVIPSIMMDWDMIMTLKGFIKSLKNFRDFERLYVPLIWLLGRVVDPSQLHEVLPPTLKEVHLSDALHEGGQLWSIPDLETALLVWLGKMSQGTPLKRLCLYFGQEDTDNYIRQELEPRLTEKCGQLGIQCRVKLSSEGDRRLIYRECYTMKDWFALR